MMRGLRVLLLLLGLVLGFAGQGEAYLVDRGGGLIYDTVLNVTWLQDVNYAYNSGYKPPVFGWHQGNKMLQVDAMRFVYQLEYYDSVRNQTLAGWRLYNPSGVNGNIETEWDSSGEMAVLFFGTLGNTSGVGAKNDGPFTGLEPYYKIFSSVDGFSFNWTLGYQGYSPLFPPCADCIGYAWAVRDGDVAPVPLPGAVWLFGSGLVGLVSLRKQLIG